MSRWKYNTKSEIGDFDYGRQKCLLSLTAYPTSPKSKILFQVERQWR